MTPAVSDGQQEEAKKEEIEETGKTVMAQEEQKTMGTWAEKGNQEYKQSTTVSVAHVHHLCRPLLPGATLCQRGGYPAPDD